MRWPSAASNCHEGRCVTKLLHEVLGRSAEREPEEADPEPPGDGGRDVVADDDRRGRRVHALVVLAEHAGVVVRPRHLPLPPADDEAVPPVVEEQPQPAPRPRRAVATPLWRKHVESFVADNWYLVLGVLMVVVGSSVLAYYTWDKH